MSRQINQLLILVGLLGATVILYEPELARAQSSTTGGVRGVVRDQKTGDPIIGATVVATSSALQGQQAQITDENGAFEITSLPPGTYLLNVYYNDATFSRPNVLVQVGKVSFQSIKIDGDARGETIIIEGKPPVVDQGSTKTGITITDEYTENIPVGRTFSQILGSAGGSQPDFYGTSVGGSTSVENTYVVEGINVTDTATGQQGSDLPHEFIEETEVITGGYNAEFGRSTGAVINVVTKQGSNEFKGSIFMNYTPGQLTAEAEPIRSEGSSISTVENLAYRYDVGAEIGGPIIKDKLWFHVGFNPRWARDDLDRIVSTFVDENGDGEPDIDPDTGFSVFEEVSRRTLALTNRTYFFSAKINGAVSQNHQYQLSGFGNPRSGRDDYAALSAPTRNFYNFTDGAYDVSGKWTSKFADGKTQVDAVVGWHNQAETQAPIDDAGAQQRIFYRFTRPFEDFAMAEGTFPDQCRDGSAADKYPMIDNCPATNYSIGGLGGLEDRENDRISGILALTQRVKLLGQHTFKVGVDAEQTTYNADRRYTGNTIYTRARSGVWQAREYVKFADDGEIPCVDTNGDGGPDLKCKVVPNLPADTKSQNIAAYLQDSWQIRPNFTINGGLRYERQRSLVAEFLRGTLSPTGEIIPDVAFELDSLAPRIGFIYDPTLEGRAKIFAHYGQFYEVVPMDINIRAFGGELTTFSFINAGANGRPNDSCLLDLTTAEELAKCTRVPPANGVSGGGTQFAAPGMKPQYINESILGVEYELMSDFKLGATYTYRNLGRVIEDISTDGGASYLITNPSENFDDEAAKLDAQAKEQEMAGNDQLATLYTLRAEQLRLTKNYDKPVRDYHGVQFTATQRFSKNAFLLASYTYSFNRGNFPGLFSTETNQLDPNLTSLYDLPALVANRYGQLGLDRPHLLKLDGFYQFDFNAAGRVVVGAGIRGQSGVARNALGSSPYSGYGTGESYLLPRGSARRSPFTWQSDIRLTYGKKIGKTQSIEAFADVLNIFNSQAETRADENYTFDIANPIIGGSRDDLAHSKTLDEGGTEKNETPVKNPNYLVLTDRQDPLRFQFGMRYNF